MKPTSKTQQKQIIGIDLGNKEIYVAYGKRSVEIRNTFYLHHRNAYLNKKHSHNCLEDLLYMLGTKYQGQHTKALWRYYNNSFTKTVNNNMVIGKKDWQGEIQQVHIQFWMAVIIRGILLANPFLRVLVHQKKTIQMIVTTFEGQYNPFRLSLRRILQINEINSTCFVSNSHCLAAYCLSQSVKSIDNTEVIGVIDFGDRGLSVTIYRLYCMQNGVVQVLTCQVNRLGGLHITSKLADHVVAQLAKSHGMDISNNPKLMHKLKNLCHQVKRTLSTSQKAFVRLDQLPDIHVYGCEISISQFQNCIRNQIAANIELISKTFLPYIKTITKVVLSGGSCNIPYFKKQFSSYISQQQHVSVVTADNQWVHKGLLSIKGPKMRLLDVSPFDVYIQGDQNFKWSAIRKGQPVPCRKKIVLKFPSGQLTFSMKIYQDKVQVGSCLLPQRPRQWNYTIYLQMDTSKILNIYGTTSFGLIKMNTNMQEMPLQDSVKYNKMVQQLDYHIEND